MPAGYWSGTPLRSVLLAVADVQTALDEYIDMLTVQLPVAERWTSLGSGVYKNPLDVSGSYMTVELIRDTATRLSIVVKDRLARTIDDASHVIVSGDTCVLYAGKNHLAMQNTPGTAGNNAFWISKLDLSPEPAGTHAADVACNLTHEPAGSARGGDASYGSVFDNYNGAAQRQDLRIDSWGSDAYGTYRMQDCAGADISTAVSIRHAVVASSQRDRVAGNLNQFAMMDRDRSHYGVYDVPIDVGTTGRFEVLSYNLSVGFRLAVRVPDDV